MIKLSRFIATDWIFSPDPLSSFVSNTHNLSICSLVFVKKVNISPYQIDSIWIPKGFISFHLFSIFSCAQKFYDGKFPHLIPPNPVIKALLIFYKDDQVSEALTRSCERLNIESSRARNVESALEVFQSPNGGHHLVLVDGRCKNIDIESFGRFVQCFFLINYDDNSW